MGRSAESPARGAGQPSGPGHVRPATGLAGRARAGRRRPRARRRLSQGLGADATHPTPGHRHLRRLGHAALGCHHQQLAHRTCPGSRHPHPATRSRRPGRRNGRTAGHHGGRSVGSARRPAGLGRGRGRGVHAAGHRLDRHLDHCGHRHSDHPARSGSPGCPAPPLSHLRDHRLDRAVPQLLRHGRAHERRAGPTPRPGATGRRLGRVVRLTDGHRLHCHDRDHLPALLLGREAPPVATRWAGRLVRSGHGRRTRRPVALLLGSHGVPGPSGGAGAGRRRRCPLPPGRRRDSKPGIPAVAGRRVGPPGAGLPHLQSHRVGCRPTGLASGRRRCCPSVRFEPTVEPNPDPLLDHRFDLFTERSSGLVVPS